MAINSAPHSDDIEFDPIGTSYPSRQRVQIKRYTNLPAQDVTGKSVEGVFGRRAAASGTPATTISIGVWEHLTDLGARISTDPLTVKDNGVAVTFDPPVKFPGAMYLAAFGDVGGDTWEFRLQFAD